MSSIWIGRIPTGFKPSGRTGAFVEKPRFALGTDILDTFLILQRNKLLFRLCTNRTDSRPEASIIWFYQSQNVPAQLGAVGRILCPLSRKIGASRRVGLDFLKSQDDFQVCHARLRQLLRQLANELLQLFGFALAAILLEKPFRLADQVQGAAKRRCPLRSQIERVTNLCRVKYHSALQPRDSNTLKLAGVEGRCKPYEL